MGKDELTGQNWPGTHAVELVDRAAQYVPAGQGEMVLALVQNAPAGQGLSVIEPAAQKLPVPHRISIEGFAQ